MSSNSKIIEWNQAMLEKIKRETNAAGIAQYDLESQEKTEVPLKASTAIPRGKFKRDPENPQYFLAHPDTIRAVRKDIFVTDPDLEDYAQVIICEGCKSEVDMQFWIHCPFCEKSFPK